MKKVKKAKKGLKITEVKLVPAKALAEVIGEEKVTRPQAVKKVWAYIKRKKLQDSKKKIMINADAKLAPLFKNKKQVSMFELAKLISANLK